jgi:lysine-specific histone demethylase 1
VYQLSTKIQIYKQHVVKRVVVEGTNVVVFGDADGKEFSKSCSYLVVTVPLGVLKSNLVLYCTNYNLPYKISFNPPLPESKQSAIARMGVGYSNKVILEFTKCFWDKAEWINYSSETPGECPFFFNPWFHYQEGKLFIFVQDLTMSEMPVIVAFLSVENSKEYERLDEKEVVHRMLSAFAKHYGDQVFECFVNGFMTKWGSDPFTMGSYSFMAKGSIPQVSISILRTNHH